MRLVYDGKLDDLFDRDTKEGKDTSLIESVIQLYRVINQGQLDSSNVDMSSISSQEAWHTVGSAGQPAYQNSWVSYGSGWNAARFYKDSLGVVHLSGLVKNGSLGNTIFTLPVGYRPATQIMFSQIDNGGVARVDVGAGGNITSFGSGNGYLTLDGITFRSEA